jgi:benzoate 4-monooxygenase
MPVEEIIAERTNMLEAGYDTTQTTLTNCIYHLAANHAKQQKLYNVCSCCPVAEEYKETRIMTSSILQQVPYLRAVLEENWRCRPPLARGLPRRTTGEGKITS